jgi:hypothetical protein
MSKFEIGERIIVYHMGDRCIGEVRSARTDSQLEVSIEGYTETDIVHIKQCRRLVRPVLRRCWLSKSDHGTLVNGKCLYEVKTELSMPEELAENWVEFKEVKKK